jgi:HD-like signal output (HDOD) protein
MNMHNPAVAAVASAVDPVDALMKSIRIPPRPSLLVDLQGELARDDPSPAAIGAIIAADVGMAGALLKLANSSFYGGARPAKSVDQAIAFLGMNQVAALMTGLLARQAITTSGASLAQFWELSTRRAQAMVFLSRRLRIGAPDVAHTFGLFCNTGVALLLERFNDYGVTYEAASNEALRRFTDIEDERHSTNHAAIGCLLARNWGLSSEVTWAILHHHDYQVIEDEASDDTVRSLVALSLLAERALQAYQGTPDSVEWQKGGARARDYLGMGDDEVVDLIDQLVECFTK